MADDIRQLNTNPINWDTVDTAWVIPNGRLFWFYNHPDGDGFCQILGDGATAVVNLTPLFTVGPKYLTSGRKFADEKTTDLGVSATGWVTILEVASGAAIPSVSGEVYVVSGGGYGLGCEYSIRLDGTPNSHARSTIKIKNPSDNASNFANIVNFRWAYSDNDSSAGAKLQVYVSTESTLGVMLLKNMDRLSAYPGAQLVTAVHEDTPLLPDGSTASYLEAGTELTWLISEINPFYASKLDDDTLYCTWHSRDLPKQDASLGTITFPSSGLRLRNGANSVTLTAGSVTTVNVSGHTVTFRLNADSGTPFSVFDLGQVIVQPLSSDGGIVWS